MSDLSIIDTDDEPTDWHGRDSDTFDTDCGDYEDFPLRDSHAPDCVCGAHPTASQGSRASLSLPNLTHGADYRDALVSRYLRK